MMTRHDLGELSFRMYAPSLIQISSLRLGKKKKFPFNPFQSRYSLYSKIPYEYLRLNSTVRWPYCTRSHFQSNRFTSQSNVCESEEEMRVNKCNRGT